MTTKPSNRQYFLSVFGRSWRTVLGFVAPIALLPFLLDYQDKVQPFFNFRQFVTNLHFCFFPLKASLCAYVLILMVIYWMFEPINLYVTGAHMTKQPFSLNQINRFFFHYTLFDV